MRNPITHPFFSPVEKPQTPSLKREVAPFQPAPFIWGPFQFNAQESKMFWNNMIQLIGSQIRKEQKKAQETLREWREKVRH